MTVRSVQAESPFGLGAEAEATLAARAERARGVAMAAGARAVASVTVSIPAELDLSAAVLRARRADDRFFCLEQPDRGGFALAGLGEVVAIEARGRERFSDVARAGAGLAGRTLADDPGRDPALLVEDERRGDRVGVEGALERQQQLAVRVGEVGVGETDVLDERARGCVAVAGVDPHELHVLALQALAGLLQ